MSIKKLSRMALLTAAALIIFTIESQIPIPIPIPGLKLGLSNIISLIALNSGEKKRDSDAIGVRDTFLILTGRIILSMFITGRVSALIYSVSGGITALVVMALLRGFVPKDHLWFSGAMGAATHNAGQIVAAVFVMGTVTITAYLPILIFAGLITGAFTGFIAQFTLERIINRDT